MNRALRLSLLPILLLAVVPTAAYAQASISGVVRDPSGGVLPGVTVEASSPALIEKVRSVVTDGNGQFRIVDLRPGTYSITFALPGFSTVKREGIELSGSFNATVNAELRVGALEETIVVTGESPVVDVQNTAQQRVLSKEVVDAIPSGRTHFEVATLLPGVNPANRGDVGGTNAISLVSLSAHGGRTADSRVMIDGLSTQNAETSGNSTGVLPNITATQEITVDVAAGSAERENGGVRINIIPRDGGNVFNGTFFASGTSGSWQSSNYTSELKAQGLLSPNRIKKLYDVNPGMGGPILRDTLWFFGSARWNANENYVAGCFRNLYANDPSRWDFVPNLDEPCVNHAHQRSVLGRITYQLTEKNKFTFLWDQQARCVCTRPSPTLSAEAADSLIYPYRPFVAATWSRPATNRLLLEAGYSYRPEKWYYPRYPEEHGQNNLDLVPVLEQSTGLNYRSQNAANNGLTQPHQITEGKVANYRASVTYVTGTHALKFGFNDTRSTREANVRDDNTHMRFRFNNGVPNQITQKATPFVRRENIGADLGVYAQDKWTLGRVTLNVGLRFDYFNNYFPEQHLGPAFFIPNRNITFPKTDWVSWKDLSPRMGAVVDLFGDARTALKVSLNKYMNGYGLQGLFGADSNPINRSANIVTRSWNDANRNYIPDCDLTSTLANGECGAMSDQNFGKPTTSTDIDADVLRGWSKRGYNWEFSTGVQHALGSVLSVDFAYFRRAYGNLLTTDNRAVSPADYTTFAVTAPVDSRLPNGGGYAVAGLRDLVPSKIGQVDNFVTFARNFGESSEGWHGFDLGVNTRFGQGIVLQGGVSTGRAETDNCEIQSRLPETGPTNAFCHVVEDWQTMIKGLGAYTIPKLDLQISATLQNLPGAAVAANYTATNAIVQPSLGRPLSGASNVTVNLVAPGTMWLERSNQIDLRIAKNLRFGRTRTRLQLDGYNVLNSDAILTANNNYASWLRPQTILTARFVKLGVQLEF